MFLIAISACCVWMAGPVVSCADARDRLGFCWLHVRAVFFFFVVVAHMYT